jgi:hypothetical protein
MATRVCWLGHSCLLFESDGQHVLVDPFLTGNPMAPKKAAEVPAHAILVSHGHGDHVGDAIDIAKRTGAAVVSNYEIGQWLQGKGLTNVHGIARRRPFVPRSARQADPRLPRLGSARWHLRRQPLRLPDHLRRRQEDLRCRRHGAVRRHETDRREGLDWRVPIGDYTRSGPDDAIRAVKMLQPKKVRQSLQHVSAHQAGRRRLGGRAQETSAVPSC